jgi:hypothetical protein
MNKPKSKRRVAGTVTKLAKALGYTARHTGSLLAKGMPDTLAEARQWLSDREDNDTATALRRERIGLVKAQRVAAELSNKKAAGELISRAEVNQQHVAIAMATQSFLRRWEREIPAVTLGLTVSQSMPLVKARTRELQNILADMNSEFWQSQPSKK